MNCEKCSKCCNTEGRSTHRTIEEKKKITKRLNIIEGQVRGINQMIAEDRYCEDILIQIAAINKSLQALGNSILESHFKSCVASSIQNGNLEMLQDAMQLIKKLQ